MTSYGKVYLSPVIDCFDGLVITWKTSRNPNADLTNGMLSEAVSTLKASQKPILHADRGVHNRWDSWIQIMKQAGLTRSMSRKACSPDNAACPVSEYLVVEASDPSEEEKRFDISKIDFDRLRKEFDRAKNKNLLMKDLQELVEQRLASVLKNNPLRINYYERYQKIVDDYNQDNQKDEIAIIFENLMKLVNDLDQEERRYVREGFSSDEELAMPRVFPARS